MEYFLKDKGKDDQRTRKKKFTDRIRRGEGVTSDAKTGSADWEVENMPTVGWDFGFLIISMWYREANHFDEGYQWGG